MSFSSLLQPEPDSSIERTSSQLRWLALASSARHRRPRARWSVMVRRFDRPEKRVMGSTRWILYVAAIYSALASAQSTPESLLGRWSARSVSPVSGFELRVELVLAEAGSTWTYTPGAGPSRDNPCFKKAFPVRVIAASAPELTLQVDGSTAQAGCPDFVVVLKRINETTYDAQFADGRHLEFSRAP